MHRQKFAVFFCLLLVPSALSHAQTSPGEPIVDVLETTVVTATRTDQSAAEVPNTVNVIDALRVREQLPRSFPEVFEEIPGVMVQKTAHGQGSPFIRGFTAFRNLLLIDGIRLNHSAFREGPNQYWATVDPFTALQIELVKGQGSVLYGSDAIGGTVNVITKSADVFGHADGEVFSEAGLAYRWASGEQSHTARLEGEVGVGGKTGIHFGYTYRDLGNIRAAGLGELQKTGYSDWGFDTRLDHYFADNVRLTLAYQQYIQDDVWRTHRTIHGRSWEGTTVGSERRRVLDQARRLAYAQLDIDDLDGFINSMQASLSWQRHEEDRDRVRPDGRRDLQGFDLDSLGAWVQFGSESAIGELAYGASFYRDTADSFRRDFNADGSFGGDRIQGPVGDDATYDLFGVFLQDQVGVTERFDLTVGARYTYASADIGRVEDPLSGSEIAIRDDWNNVSGSVRGMWDAAGDGSLNFYGGVSQGFRSPNLSDLSRLDSARSSEIETPSPGLEPEKFISYELGTRVERDRVRAGLAVFFTDIEDIISRTPTGRMIDGDAEIIKRNGGSGYVYGVEFDAAVDLTDRVTLFGNFAWNDGKADTFPTSSPVSEEEYVSRLLPPTGLLGVRWDATDTHWLEVTGQAVGKQDRLNTSDRGDSQRIPPGGTPGFALLNVRAGWQATENLLLTAAVENLTDEEYRAHGSGQNEPGINFVLGASLKF